MEFSINKIESKFIPLTSSEVERSISLSNLARKLCLLADYDNHDIKFSKNESEIFKLPLNDKTILIFGSDINGYYFIDESVNSVCYLGEIMENIWRVSLCNTNIDKFICFNNLFIYMLTKRIEEIKTSPDDDLPTHIADALEKHFIDMDGDVMIDSDYFWPSRVFAFSEDFFPLTNSHIEIAKRIRGKRY